MNCKFCDKKSVSDKGLCKEHFIEYVENNVFNTIRKYKLFNKNNKVIVATSGGKDSLTALYLTKKYIGNTGEVYSLAIDEGIKGYRDNTLIGLKKFCKKYEIQLNIVSFKKEFGTTLDKVLKENPQINPCTFCGIIRRYLINKHSKNYDAVILGHNLDDESQSIMMNVLRGNLEISSRLGPITGLQKSDKFTKRVKPLYFLAEKDIKIYSVLMGFKDEFIECPYSGSSYRAFVRDFLNKEENNTKGIKSNIINNFIKILPKFKKYYNKTETKIEYCKYCGFPAKNEVCNTCSTLEKLNLLKNKR